MADNTRPPCGLQPAGKALWRGVHAAVAEGWELDQRDLAWLEQACRTRDLIADLERQLAAEGLAVEGSKGQRRLHGVIPELRQQRDLLSRLLARLELKPPRERTGHLNARQRVALSRRREGEARYGTTH